MVSSVVAQTLLVHQGQTAIAYPATNEAVNFDENTFSINGNSYAINTTDSICTSSLAVADNTVSITYANTTAQVIVAANIAPLLSIQVNGAHVSVMQSSNVTSEITYTLQGTSSDGSFWMDGSLKATVALNNLNLTCADSAAVNIRNGKRINIILTDGTINTLADGKNGSQKGCLMVKGHSEFKGNGSLFLTGNTQHAFWGGEYVELKKSTGTITVTSAVKDAFNINQYFSMKGGTVLVKTVGDDGIQVSRTDDETDDLNGQFYLSGGTLTIYASGKGICAADNLYINGGELNVICSGGEGSEGIESKKKIYITDGTIVVNSYDDAINAANKIDISGGRIYAYATNNDGIDSNGMLYISGGLVIATGTNQPEEGFDCDQNTFSITGGTLIGIGGSSSTPTSSVTTQPVTLLSRMSLTQGKQLTLQTSDGTLIWSFLIPRTLNQATILISTPQLSVGSSYTLTTGGTLSDGVTWQGYTTDATASGGSTLSTFTQSSIVNGSGSSMGGGGGPGGGGGGPGGRP